MGQCRRVVVAALVLTAAAHKGAPYSGAPFLRPAALATLPSHTNDADDPSVVVQRLLPNNVNRGAPNKCDLGKQADKEKCLSNPDRECMWVSTEGFDPLAPIQAVESLCLPCSMDGEPLPCWNIGAVVGGVRVTNCEMTCPHQTRIRQPEYACGDESGFITTSQCFDKGTKSGSKCMWLAYEKDGVKKSTCGPCYVSGTGGFGCPAAGTAGPEDGSTVTGCLDQCAVICPGPPGCPPTAAPPPPPPPPSPGVVQTSSDPNEMLIAPAPVSMPTINPYAVAQAAMEVAKKAGWVIGTPPPPKSYDPVIIYRRPIDYMFTPGPPPAMMAAPAPPGAFLQRAKHFLQRSFGKAAEEHASQTSEPAP